jgi:hypothetical protein
VLNATAHKDWATKDNSILVEPSSLKDCYDDIFFKKDQPFNQGQFFDITDAEIENAILRSVPYAKTPNPSGVKLQKDFTYEKTVETMLCAISSQV